MKKAMGLLGAVEVSRIGDWATIGGKVEETQEDIH